MAQSTMRDLTRTEVASPTLLALRGQVAGTRFLIPDSEVLTIGRHPDSDIFLDDVTVSRHHAVIHGVGDILTIEDQGSLDGTFVNDERIVNAVLTDLDVIGVGKFRLLFQSRVYAAA